MIAFLISLAPFIPAILSVVSYLIKLFGASEQTMKDYEDMIKQCNDAGILSVSSHDKLLAHKQAILDRIKAKADAAQKAADTTPKAP